MTDIISKIIIIISKC